MGRAAGRGGRRSPRRRSSSSARTIWDELTRLHQDLKAADQGRRGRGRRRAGHRRVPARPLALARGADGGLARAPALAQRRAAAGPRRLHRAPEARQAARAPPRGARRRRRHRLGARRVARLRLAADRGHADPPDRPGRRARHVLPAPHGPARRQDGPDDLPDPVAARRARAVRAAQLAAERDRLPGLRVRLLGRGARDARAVGGAVRRLRQRRAGHHRPVHRLRPGQVGPDVAPDAAAAARLRGLGPRALLGPPGALPAARRRGQHPRGEPDDAGAVLPPAAPPGAHRQAAPADHHDPEVAAAPAAGDQPHRAPLRDAASSPCSASRGCRSEKVTRLVLCTGKIYYDLVGHPSRAGQRGAWPSAASSCSTPSPRRRSSSWSTATRTCARSSGSRRSRATWAPARTCRRASCRSCPEHLEFGYIGRPERASPGEGYPAAHTAEQNRILRTALDLGLPVTLYPAKLPGER